MPNVEKVKSSNKNNNKNMAQTLRKFNNNTPDSSIIALIKFIFDNLPDELSLDNNSQKIIFSQTTFKVIKNSDETMMLFELNDSFQKQIFFFLYNRAKKLLTSSLSREQYLRLVQNLKTQESVEVKHLLALTPLETSESIEKSQKTLLEIAKKDIKLSKRIHTKSTDEFSQAVDKNFQENKGLVLLQRHDHQGSLQRLAAEIASFKKQNVTHLFIELVKIDFEILFNIFNECGDMKFLKSQLEYRYNLPPLYINLLLQVAEAAYKNGIQIIPIDVVLYEKSNRTIDELSKERSEHNYMIAYHINNTCKKMQPDSKYIVMLGAAHHQVADMLGTRSILFLSPKDIEKPISGTIDRAIPLARNELLFKNSSPFNNGYVDTQNIDHIFLIKEDENVKDLFSNISSMFLNRYTLFGLAAVSSAIFAANYLNDSDNSETINELFNPYCTK